MRLKDRATLYRDNVSIETRGPKHSLYLHVWQAHGYSEYSIGNGSKVILSCFVPSVFYRATAREVRCVGR